MSISKKRYDNPIRDRGRSDARGRYSADDYDYSRNSSPVRNMDSRGRRSDKRASGSSSKHSTRVERSPSPVKTLPVVVPHGIISQQIAQLVREVPAVVVEAATDPLAQRLTMPWTTRDWQLKRAKINEPIKSIIDMDIRLSWAYGTQYRTKTLHEILANYGSDARYTEHKISEEKMISEVFPTIQKLCDNAINTFKSFDTRPLLPGISANIVLSRLQAATLIALMWFNQFDYKILTPGPFGNDELAFASLIGIFNDKILFPFASIIEYFSIIHDEIARTEAIHTEATHTRGDLRVRKLILIRNVIDTQINWLQCDAPICDVKYGDTLNIEASDTTMCALYTSRDVGGDFFTGVLSDQEVFMCGRPESLIVRIFCAQMSENESVVLLGAERLIAYTGTPSNIQFKGRAHSDAPIGATTEFLLQQGIIWLDAGSKTRAMSLFVEYFDRDLDKAYAGFSAPFPAHSQIACTHWNYKSTVAPRELKFLQLVLAASAAGKSLVYHAESREFESAASYFLRWLKLSELTVAGLIDRYSRAIKNELENGQITLTTNIFDLLIAF